MFEDGDGVTALFCSGLQQKYFRFQKLDITFQNIARVQNSLVVSNVSEGFPLSNYHKGISYGFKFISFYFLQVSFLIRLLNEDVRKIKENK